MQELDESVSLFFGDALPFEDSFVYPLTIGEIKKLEFSNFYTILQLLIADENDLETIPEHMVVYPFDIFYSNIVYSQDLSFTEKIFDFLKGVFRVEYIMLKDDYICVGDNITLHIHNYDAFVEIIKKQYCIKKEVKKQRTEGQKEYDRMLAEKRKKYAKWIEDESEDITDLMSSICAIHPTINSQNIQDLTVYYLINQFKRIMKRDDYFIGIKSLLAGASSKDVKIVHWSKKIVS